jgi:hypothetical protein
VVASQKSKIILLWAIGIILALMMFSHGAKSDEMVHKFKSPSFSGINSSSHYLTIENQEKTRRDAIKDDINAALLAAQRAEENTTLAKFMRNLESRIFAQLSKQLVEQLFSGEGSTFGSFMIDGNMITYEQTVCNPASMACTEGEDVIIMTIVDPNGSQTVIIIPIGTGTFAGTDGG